MCASKYFNMGNLVVTSGIYEAMKESKRFTLDVGIYKDLESKIGEI